MPRDAVRSSGSSKTRSGTAEVEGVRELQRSPNVPGARLYVFDDGDGNEGDIGSGSAGRRDGCSSGGRNNNDTGDHTNERRPPGLTVVKGWRGAKIATTKPPDTATTPGKGSNMGVTATAGHVAQPGASVKTQLASVAQTFPLIL